LYVETWIFSFFALIFYTNFSVEVVSSIVTHRDLYDAPSLSVEREVLEESGYRTRAVKLLALWDRERHGHPPLAYHSYKIVFLCELLDDKPVIEFQKDNIETDGVGFFARYAIPPLSETRVMPAQVDRLFELHAIPTAPTEFD
jgi:hypothetical protein